MFTNISWSSYITAVSLLLLVYYLFLGFKFYYSELQQIMSGKQKIKSLNFRNKENLRFNSSGSRNLKEAFSSSFDTLDDAEELSERLLKAVSESANRNLSKEEFQNYLRLLLSEYPFVKISVLRESINRLIVSESEKHPNLLLTYAITDSLWDEAV
jgi:hypothetical protein